MRSLVVVWAFSLACSASSAAARGDSPGPAADQPEDLRKVVDAAAGDFASIRGAAIPSPKTPGRPEHLDEMLPSLRHDAYEATFELWGAPKCTVTERGGPSWYYACMFGGNRDDATVGARYESLKKSIAAALPNLEFSERDLPKIGCDRKMYTAEDKAKKLDIYVFFDKSTCTSAINTLNVVVSQDREAAPRPTSEKAAPELVKADLDFAEASKTRGVEGWADAFTDNGAQLTRKGELVVGRDKIRDLMAPSFKDSKFSLDWTPTRGEIAPGGHLGYTWGRYIAKFQNEQGQEVTERGQYMTVWKKQADGRWKVVFDTGEPDK